MKALQDLEIFVRTVDAGSLSAAARSLDITPAAASAALQRLEAELQTALLVRSTRSLRLTPEGAVFLEHCRLALNTLREGQQTLATGRQQVQGTLRLAVSSDLGRNLLLPWLDAFQDQHPQVRFRLQVSDRMANIFSEPVDAAFRYGEPPDSNLVALPVALDNRRVLCASPAYLQRHGTPSTPADLARHDCLCFLLGEDVNDRWEFSHNGHPTTVRVGGGHVANDGDLVRRWAIAGRGIAYKSWLDVAQPLADGRLQALCNDWDTEAAPLYMVLPDRRQLTPALRLLREFVAVQCAALPTGSKRQNG
ncbi:MAG: LysR family transcriptional regulator [Burkholderiales bacterium]|nr:LysR family transcriptional regulator [Burkholderiales bacterium]